MNYKRLFEHLYKTKHQLEFDIEVETSTALDGGDPCSSKVNSERLLQLRRHLKTVEDIIDVAFESIQRGNQ